MKLLRTEMDKLVESNTNNIQLGMVRSLNGLQFGRYGGSKHLFTNKEQNRTIMYYVCYLYDAQGICYLSFWRMHKETKQVQFLCTQPTYNNGPYGPDCDAALSDFETNYRQNAEARERMRNRVQSMRDLPYNMRNNHEQRVLEESRWNRY